MAPRSRQKRLTFCNEIKLNTAHLYTFLPQSWKWKMGPCLWTTPRVTFHLPDYWKKGSQSWNCKFQSWPSNSLNVFRCQACQHHWSICAPRVLVTVNGSTDLKNLPQTYDSGYSCRNLSSSRQAVTPSLYIKIALEKDTVDGSETLLTSWYGKYPIIFLQGFIHSQVVVWDFWTINSSSWKTSFPFFEDLLTIAIAPFHGDFTIQRHETPSKRETHPAPSAPGITSSCHPLVVIYLIDWDPKNYTFLNECSSLILLVICCKKPKFFRFKVIPPLEGSMTKDVKETERDNMILWKQTYHINTLDYFTPKSHPKKTRTTPSRPVDSEGVLLAPQSSVGSEFPWRLRLSTRGESHRIHGNGIFTYVWFDFVVTVGKETMHGSYWQWLILYNGDFQLQF